MKKRTAKTLSKALDWARTAPRSNGGPQCRVCKMPEGAREAIDGVAGLIKRGESAVSLRQLTEYVNAEFKTQISIYSVRNHFSGCLKMRLR